MKNTGPVWQFAKNCVDRFLISVFVLFPQSSVLPTDFNDVYDFYKKGNYDTLVKVSRVALRKEEIDYRILLLYTSAEKDPEEIDKTLRSIYEKKGSHPGIFYNSVFLFLERCLVLEDESSGIYWGKIFSENGTSSVRYAEGLYTYACILYEAGKFSEAKQILIKLRELKSAEKLAKKIRILELSVEKKRSKDVKALKVQAGKLKGKSIETPIAVAGNTNFTPAILKKSVFDIVGSLVLKGRLILEKSVFVDFFAGSGQMALEAMSRGFARVVLYELAWERSDNLRKLFAKFSDNYEVSRKDVFRFYNKLDIPEKSKIYFLDPPYSF
ncbi:hypothetical protein LEP1GSC137_2358 [Leptospira borgpetersenii str. Noumea 25]|nr:hypothetical protein LEP1GSC137_2358 [Leptospira borgpetersenii str. Noumea 25]